MYINEKRRLYKMPMLYDKRENMRYSILSEQRKSDLSHIVKGFTLVEIIIVVVIVSIAAMITVEAIHANHDLVSVQLWFLEFPSQQYTPISSGAY